MIYEWEPKPDTVCSNNTEYTMDVPGGFQLFVRVNRSGTTAFPDATAATFEWYIERRESLPAGEERTVEEAQIAALKRFKAMRTAR